VKKTLLFILLLLLIVTRLSSQITKITHKTVTLVEQRSIKLNGGGRAAFGGKSRTCIEIDLPKNTIEWYYCYTTSANENETSNLNLAVQLTSLLFPITAILGSSGITQQLLSSIKIPAGSHVLDVYLIGGQYVNSFLNKTNFNYEVGGSVENTTQCTNMIQNHNSGTWYLALRNPSSLYAVNIKIEVVAIVEELE